MKPDPFVAHCTELLGSLGPVRSRAMFGGYGICAGGLFGALIAFDRSYLKAGEHACERFAAAGSAGLDFCRADS